jgi:recombination protein RecA
MTIDKIKKELLYFYEYDDLADLTGISKSSLEKITDENCSNKHKAALTDFLNKHCDCFAEEVTIPDIISDKGPFPLIDTPDGYQEIVRFVVKPQKPCIKITTSGNNILQCAVDHLVQLDINDLSDCSWVTAGSLEVGQSIETKIGRETISGIEELPIQDVYDFEVGHKHHRYWASNFSNHNTGKSLFVQKILANAQKEGLIPVIFDTENAIDPEGAQRLGLDISNVKYVPCISIEQTRNAIFKLLTAIKEKKQEGKFIIAIDSLGNLQSELELARMDKESTSSDMGTKARAIKSLMQTCTNLGAITQTTIVCTNHVYDDPSAMFPSIEKNMPGGKSVVYLPSVTVQLARKPVKDDGGKMSDSKLAVSQKSYAGIIIRALTRKNRFLKQYLEGEMYLSFSTGLDRFYGLLDIATGLEVITQTGSTYQLADGTKIGYYKNFRKDIKLWEETIIPKLEEKIKNEWTYSNLEGEEDVPVEIEDDEDES